MQALRRWFSTELKLRLTPHQYYITQGKGQERPFTGDYWYVQDPGNYNCVVCDNLLFPSHFKYFPDTGHAAFWASAVDATKITHTHNGDEVQCNKCGSHLGYLHQNGPHPTKLHYQIKSGSLKFNEKGWFTIPPTRKVLRKLRRSQDSSDKNISE